MNIIIAVSGASGSIYARLLLDRLAGCPSVEKIGVVFSPNARSIWKDELGCAPDIVHPKMTVYDHRDFSAEFASGSAGYEAMVVIPASMGMVARIASGVSDDLITRSADVILKERGRLILVPRETPFSYIHLQNMSALTLAGAVVLPAAPAFYARPADIAELCGSVVDKVLKQLGLDDGKSYKWKGK